ncbi:tetratricopeptide repeat protein [Glycomyces harbinensis]|uniref:tetratricopeptide repeat protein n=1 Tax=Glycomyces harbinensis TaxID=58114 RepID=UPI000B87A55B|nr:tetratricopeptide repeat protein [Glycomyces harbinensis]
MTDAPDPGTVRGLAAWLAAHLSATGRSPADAARQLGVPESTVNSWLAGHRDSEEDESLAHLETHAMLGDWLRGRIADSGCSVREIAASTEGVSTSTVYNWLRGEHLPRPPVGDEPDRFDLLLSNPRLGLNLRQRLRLDETRRRLTGTSMRVAEPGPAWKLRGLPADNRSFTGRSTHLRRLDRLLLDHARGRAPVVAALTGIGGAGKTALAVRWSRTREVQATFTDGCLYLNLHGYADTPPMRPGDAMTKLLIQLGVEPRRLPADLDARAALYQQVLTGRRLLLILDNAHDEAQARPLLPTGPGCLALLTSRSRMHGLAASHPGVVHLPLEPLTGAEATGLLRGLLGPLAARTASGADLEALAAACGHLPLALQIAAADFLTHRHPQRVTVGEYARSLAEDRLAGLSVTPTDPSTSLADSIDRSYRHLTDEAKRAYRLLGLHPGPDCTAEAAASLLARPLPAARTALLELAQASLLSEHDAGRYTFHDLVREHAVQRCRGTDPESERRAAVDRLLDHYLHTAHAATLSLNPNWESIALDPLGPHIDPERFERHADATAWFTAEHPALLAAVVHAHDSGRWTRAWQLAWSISDYLDRLGLWHEQAAAGAAAMAAAEHLGDDTALLHAHRVTARAAVRLGRFDEADRRLQRVLELTFLLGGEREQAHQLLNLAYLREQQGRTAAALELSGRALRLYRTADFGVGQARALNAVAWYHALQREFDQALVHCLESLRLCEALDFGYGKAGAWATFGYVQQHLDEPDEARSGFEQALELYLGLGDRYEVADTLVLLGDLHLDRNAADAARDAWHEAATILTDLDHPDAARIRAKLADLDAPAVGRG